MRKNKFTMIFRRLLFIIPTLLVLFFASCENGNSVDDIPKTTIATDTTLTEEERAFKEINELLKTDVNNTGLYLRRARLYQKYGDFNAAVNDLNRAIKIDSLIPEFYLLKAELLKNQDKFKEAKEVLDKCMYVDNDNVQARVELGWLALYTYNHKQALDYADAALKRDMYNAEAYYLKGMIFLDKKDTALAKSSFKTAVEQENDYYSAYIQLGLLYFYDESNISEGYFKNALRIDPKSLEALYSIAYYYQERGEYEKAMEHYQKSIDIQPYREPYFNMGYIHHEYLQEYEKAIEYYTKAINVEPRYLDAYFNRGLCYELMKNNVKAKADFQKVLEFNPTHTNAAKALERVY